MANLLVLGVGPLPFESGQRLHAPGIRTWQIAAALATRRHYVTLCVIEFGDFKADERPGKGQTAIRQDVGLNIGMIKLKYHPTHTTSSIRTLHSATRFSAVVSTTDIMNAVTADLNLEIPSWLDYNGDPFAEKQLQARLYQHDGSLLPQWELYFKGLSAGDRFSVCSEPQRHALIGQLAFAGRLSAKTSGEDMVQVLPNCSRVMSERTPRRTLSLKGNQIPASAFLVLWSGGYNTWSDPETLFHGLEAAMKSNESIYFATTGGAIDGHDNRSFQIFQDLVEKSEFRERFVFLGWVPTEEVGAYYEQADLAIYTDRYSVEGELGTRTRLVDWIQYKTPIACTELCELSRDLAANHLILTFKIGDADALAGSILESAANPEAGKERAVKAHQWFDRNLDEKVVLAPLLKWAETPRFAKDRQRHPSHQDVASPPMSNLTQLLTGALSQTNTSAKHAFPATRESTSEKPSIKQNFLGLFTRKS